MWPLARLYLLLRARFILKPCDNSINLGKSRSQVFLSKLCTRILVVLNYPLQHWYATRWIEKIVYYSVAALKFDLVNRFLGKNERHCPQCRNRSDFNNTAAAPGSLNDHNWLSCIVSSIALYKVGFLLLWLLQIFPSNLVSPFLLILCIAVAN